MKKLIVLLVVIAPVAVNAQSALLGTDLRLVPQPGSPPANCVGGSRVCLWYDGNAAAFKTRNADGTDTIIGSGASIGGTVSGGSSGSVLFLDGSIHLVQDNANFSYDSSAHKLTLSNLAVQGAGNRVYLSNTHGTGPFIDSDQTGSGITNSAAEIWFVNGDDTLGGYGARTGLRQHDAQTAGEDASGWQLYVEAAAGGNANGSVNGGTGALTILAGGLGGDGSATKLPGNGGQATLRGGNAGTNLGGGGANGGPTVITGGHGNTGAASGDGLITIGASFTKQVELGSFSGGTGTTMIPTIIKGSLVPDSTYGINSTGALPIAAGANSTWSTSAGYLIIQPTSDLDLYSVSGTVVLGQAGHNAQIGGTLTANVKFAAGNAYTIGSADSGAGGGGGAITLGAGTAGAASGGPGAQGGQVTIQGQTGGAGDATHAPGVGGWVEILGGVEGTYNGNGGNNGGDIIIDGGTTVHGSRNGAVFIGTSLNAAAHTFGVYLGGSATNVNLEGPILPLTDNGSVQYNGNNSARWKAVMSYWHDTALGAQLTAAATITPTGGLHHVTGGTTITTIAVTNIPTSGKVELTLIADGGTITLNTGGNIGANCTIAQNTHRRFVYDGSTWYPEN